MNLPKAHKAVMKRDAELLERVLAENPKEMEARATDESGWTAVHIAAAFGRLQEMRVLERMGADMFAKSAYGHTIAHLGALFGKEEILIDAARIGIWLEEPDLKGHRPADLARGANRSGCERLIDELAKAQAEKAALEAIGIAEEGSKGRGGDSRGAL